jgi:putative spermidine/putrescine transport system ATP-binding protein
LAFLELKGLIKTFGSFAAVDGLELAVERGEFVALLGPSGCGKTTTLHMVAGFVEPNAGMVSIDGRDMAAVKPNRRNIGVVFQSYALFPHMTVAENVGFGLEMRDVAAAERQRRMADALDLVRLGTLAQRFPRQLSGGQQQRVALARALVIRPDLLLLDEPLSNLDAKLREEMRVEIRLIQRQVGITTILVTHDQAEALVMSDRVAVMERGRIVQIDRPVQVYENPASAFVSNFLGRANLIKAEIVARAGQRLSVTAGGTAFEVAGDAPPGPVTISVRPERIGFVETGGIEARIKVGLFMGDQWLYRLDTALGELTVCRPNAGGPRYEEGTAVRIAWPSDAVRVLHG